MSQGIHTGVSRWIGAAAVAFALAAASVLFFSSPAAAHDELTGSDPAAGAMLKEVPAQLTLTFSGDIATDEGASEVQVTDAAGTALVAGPTSAAANVLTVPLSGEGSGAVTVLWKVVSSDGHPISGEFAFTVTPDTTPTPTPTPTESETTEPTEEPTETATPLPIVEEGPEDMTWAWIVIALVAVGLAGAVVYLLVSRARREAALEENRRNALSGPPGADPGADPVPGPEGGPTDGSGPSAER